LADGHRHRDIAIEEDVIEEVARTIGYDAVPEIALAGRVPASIEEPDRAVREEIRDLLVRAGLQETISYSLVSHELLEKVGAVGGDLPEPLHTVNPMSREQEFMRTSLRGSILRSAATGLRRPPGRVALFEMGRIFIPRADELPEEREQVVAVLAGSAGDSLWKKAGADLDFYEAKGVVEVMLERLGLGATFERGEDTLLHPGRTARVLANGTDVGVIGELHPRTIAAFDFPADTVALVELDLGKLAGEVQWKRHQFVSFSRYPSADRDLALVVDAGVPAERLLAAMEEHELVVGVTLFDVFAGEGLTAGKKSLAYRLTLQSAAGTLTADQVNDAVAEIVGRLETETGATLRR